MFFRLQEGGIGISQMKSHTSDFSNEVSDDPFFYSEEEEEGEELAAAAAAEYIGTICATDSPEDFSFGGAAGLDDDAEVVVLEGTIAFRIYDGVRLYSDSITEIARHSYKEWREGAWEFYL